MIARVDFGRAMPKSIQDRCSSSGSLAMLAAMRQASSRLSSLAAVQGTGATFSQKAKPPLTIPEHR